MTEHSQSPQGTARLVEKLSPRQAFARAVALQREGQLADAEKLYHGVLRLDANHVDALHNLGIIRIRQGRALPRQGGEHPDVMPHADR